MIHFAREAQSPAVRIALLGCGTVGREVARLLVEEADALAERFGVRLDPARILVRDTTKDRGLPPELFTDRFEEVLDTEPDVVIELIDGVEPARLFVEQALTQGIPVITANKTLIAHHGQRLHRLARRFETDLRYEAAVGASLPILTALRQLAGDRILSIRGVVNGSCNFILTRMERGATFEDALDEAKQRGLVEPDPSADLSGRDSVEKLCVLAAVAGFVGISADEVECTGIESITREDIIAARRHGCTIKLLAEVDFSDASPSLRVGPALVPRSHPLARIEDEHNGFVITTELAGDIILEGRGAGPRPTASAILGDLAQLVARRVAVVQPSAGAGAGPARLQASKRRQYVRVQSRAVLTPQRLFSAVRAAGLTAEEIEITPNDARLIAHCNGSTPIVVSSGSPEGVSLDVLAVPILDHEPA